jgi:hypothetical protein
MRKRVILIGAFGNSMKTISVLLSVLFLTVSANAESDSVLVRTGADGKSWTIGNALVEREVRFESQRGLHTASWRHVVTGTDFMSAAGPNRSGGSEFSFEADGDSLPVPTGPRGNSWARRLRAWRPRENS